MQKLKQTGIALMVAGLLSANAYASEAAVEQVTAQPVAAFTDADLNALFEQEADKPMQLAVLSGQEMRETDGAFAFVPFLAYSLASGAGSAWLYHGRSFRNTGQLGSASGAAWAAGSGILGGIHGRGLAAGAGLTGWGNRIVSAHGMAVSGAWNLANPFRR